jgi:hypothetical protein
MQHQVSWWLRKPLNALRWRKNTGPQESPSTIKMIGSHVGTQSEQSLSRAASRAIHLPLIFLTYYFACFFSTIEPASWQWNLCNTRGIFATPEESSNCDCNWCGVSWNRHPIVATVVHYDVACAVDTLLFIEQGELRWVWISILRFWLFVDHEDMKESSDYNLRKFRGSNLNLWIYFPWLSESPLTLSISSLHAMFSLSHLLGLALFSIRSRVLVNKAPKAKTELARLLADSTKKMQWFGATFLSTKMRWLSNLSELLPALRRHIEREVKCGGNILGKSPIECLCGSTNYDETYVRTRVSNHWV